MSDLLNDQRDQVHPNTQTEARKALDARRLNGTARTVTLRHFPHKSGTTDHHLDVHGPADGTPLTVDVWSGFHLLHVRSGNVEIHAGSVYGNSVDVHGDAHVQVRGGSDRKVTVTARDNASVVCDFRTTDRGRVYAEGAADVHVHTKEAVQ